jgi:hypothetical protein
MAVEEAAICSWLSCKPLNKRFCVTPSATYSLTARISWCTKAQRQIDSSKRLFERKALIHKTYSSLSRRVQCSLCFVIRCCSSRTLAMCFSNIVLTSSREPFVNTNSGSSASCCFVMLRTCGLDCASTLRPIDNEDIGALN